MPSRVNRELIPYEPIDAADAETLRCVQLSERDILLLLSQCSYFYWKRRYVVSNPSIVVDRLVVAEWAATVESRLLNATDCEIVVTDCEQFTPEQTWVAFFPNDPFSTPDYTPAGYLLPPFYTNPAIPLSGVLPTDAILNFAAIPMFQSWADLLETGLPRCLINVSGAGQVEVELVKIPQGGFAALWVDQDIATMRIVELAEFSITDFDDLSEFVGMALDGLVQTEIVEFDIIDAGEHQIEVVFLPNVGGDIILGFGGGIRSIELCNGLVAGDAFEMQMRTIDSGENCQTVQWRPASSGAWIDLYEVCPPPPLHIGFDAANCVLKYTQGDINSPYVGGDWISVFDWTIPDLRDCLGLAGNPNPPTGVELISDMCRIAWGAGQYFVGDVSFIHAWDLANGPFMSKPNLLGNIYAEGALSWLTLADVFRLSPVAAAWDTPTAGQQDILDAPQTTKRYAEAFYCSLSVVEGVIRFNKTIFNAFIDNLITGNSIVDDAMRTYASLIANERMNEYFAKAALEITDADCLEFDCLENLAPLLQVIGGVGTLSYDGLWHYATVGYNGQNFSVAFTRVGGGCYTITDYEVLEGINQSAQNRTLCAGSPEFTDTAGTLNVSLLSHGWRGNSILAVRFKVELD